MQSLIAQLKRLAEAQKECDRENDDGSLLAEVLGAYGNGSRIMRVVNTFFIEFDFPALLAHLERTQAVVDAARSERIGIDHTKTCRIHRAEDCTCGGWDAFARLNAALENLENNDGVAALTGETK